MAEPVVEITGADFPSGLPSRACRVVRDGGVLIHPTATVHGYGCRFDMSEPVERIRRYKGRDSGKPMIVLVPSASWLDRLCRRIPDEARILAGKFWPAGLTLVLQASRQFREQCCWPGATVALRQSAHPFTAALLDKLAIPLVSTSLGRSGEPVPIDSLEFTRSLYLHSAQKRIEPPELAVLDRKLAGANHLPSTLVDASVAGRARLLRAGAVPAEKIELAIGYKIEHSN